MVSDHFKFNKETANPEYIEEKLPVVLDNTFEINMNIGGYRKDVNRTGRDVINAVLALLSWVARFGIATHTAGRPSRVEPAKGAFIIIGDPKKMFDKKV